MANVPPSPARRAAVVVLLLTVLAVATAGPRAPLYAALAGGSAASPLAGVVGAVAEVGLLALVALVAGLAVVSWRRDRARLVGLVASGVGVVAAYGTSELVKLLVNEERPCRAVDGVTTVLACPPAGDWSWPSNHATIAAALATALVLAAPRLWAVAGPLALAVALARVGAGVHYVHDVASGLALGTAVTALVGLALHGPVRRTRAAARFVLGPATTTTAGHRATR